MLRIKFIAAALCLTFAVSCNKPVVVNKEKVFSYFEPQHPVYRDKLAEKVIRNQGELTYTFERYIDEKNIEIIITGKDFVANCFVEVNNWKGIEGILEAKGGGYRGAELEGLQLDIYSKPEGAIFIYKDIKSIND